jgi:hypothetical protein
MAGVVKQPKKHMEEISQINRIHDAKGLILIVSCRAERESKQSHGLSLCSIIALTEAARFPRQITISFHSTGSSAMML